MDLGEEVEEKDRGSRVEDLGFLGFTLGFHSFPQAPEVEILQLMMLGYYGGRTREFNVIPLLHFLMHVRSCIFVAEIDLGLNMLRVSSHCDSSALYNIERATGTHRQFGGFGLNWLRASSLSPSSFFPSSCFPSPSVFYVVASAVSSKHRIV